MTASSKRRSELWLRYAALVRDQEDALQDGDMDRFGTLADERQRLQDAVDALPWPADRSDLEGLSALRAAVEVDRRIVALLRHLRDDSRDAVRESDARTAQARRYLEGAPGAVDGEVDLRG